MVANTIDMSLADIIKNNKKMKKSQVTRGRGRGGNKARGRGAARGRGGNRANSKSNNQSVLRKTRGGGVGQRRGNRGGGRGKPAAAAVQSRPASGRGRGRGRGRGGRGRGSSRPVNGTVRPNQANTSTARGKITVRNLQWGVSDSDIKELFGQFGPLVNSAIHYDASGRSLGVADVTFKRNGDAEKACNKYNGVPLDGRPMEIEVVGKKPVVDIASRLGKKPAPPARGGQNKQASNQTGGARRGGRGGARGGRGRGRGGRGGGQKRQPKVEVTAEELDSQLESYISKMEE